MGLIGTFLFVYEIVVFVAIIASWIQSDNIVFQLARELTEPVLRQIRRFLPAMGGLDLSPMVLLIGLQFLRIALTR